MDKYMTIAYKQALKAYKRGDVPVGCVIVKNNKIISKAYNKKHKKNIATMHAEILAINKACKKLKTWHLDDCILYSTMEPCKMCAGAIIQCRIHDINYSISNSSFGDIENNKTFINKKYKVEKIENDQIKLLIQNFFKKKR